jgi:hypothetical protein
MTKFIKVTESYVNGNAAPVLINVDNILTIKTSERSSDTHIMLKDNKYLFAKETVDSIWLMLIIDNAKAPVVMNAVEAEIYYRNGAV